MAKKRFYLVPRESLDEYGDAHGSDEEEFKRFLQENAGWDTGELVVIYGEEVPVGRVILKMAVEEMG